MLTSFAIQDSELEHCRGCFALISALQVILTHLHCNALAPIQDSELEQMPGLLEALQLMDAACAQNLYQARLLLYR